MVSTPNITFIHVVEIPEATIGLRTDGIIQVNYKKNVTLDVALQVSMRKIFNELTNGKKSYFIFSAAEGFTLTKEARENYDMLNADSSISGYGIVADNLAYKLIANFYLKINKPKFPFKVFSSVEEAAKWLNSL